MSRPKLVPELYCSSLARSVDFYTQVLGFEVRYARPEQRFAFLQRGGAEIMLEQTLEPSRLLLAGPLEYPFGRGMHLQIEVGDIQALHAAVLRMGTSLLLPMEERWYRSDAVEIGQFQFAVTDPDGYVLRFFQPLGERPLIPS